MRATPYCRLRPRAISPYVPPRSRPPRKTSNRITPGPPALHDHAGFGNRSGLAPALSAGKRQTSSPFCHCPTAQGLALSWLTYLMSPHTVLNVERSEEHTSELQSRLHLVCRLLLEKKKK